MKIAIQEMDGITVVYPHGPRLDAATAPGFKSQMVDLISNGTTRIILDLSRIDFMDSTGLSSIMSTLKTVSGQGEMALCGLSEKLKRLLSVTKLDRGVFRIFESRSEALRGLSADDG